MDKRRRGMQRVYGIAAGSAGVSPAVLAQTAAGKMPAFQGKSESFSARTDVIVRVLLGVCEEANGVWWLPRSSKPLFRRGSVERLVRFRRASASRYRTRVPTKNPGARILNVLA